MTHKDNLKDLLFEDMITRRMENTGEDRRTACMAIKKYICQHLTELRGETPNY